MRVTIVIKIVYFSSKFQLSAYFVTISIKK